MLTIIIVSLNLSNVQKCSKGLCQKDWSSSDKTDNQLSNHGYFLEWGQVLKYNKGYVILAT